MQRSTSAARFADRVALLAEGRVHAIGTPAEVLTGAIVDFDDRNRSGATWYGATCPNGTVTSTSC